MEKRARSPNYPAVSLPDAIEKVTALYRNMHSHPAPREVVAKGMGYNSLNGASATAISALHKYGLLERVGSDEIKVSERALRILHPHDPAERRVAITEAATAPQLFVELAERFPGRIPNEELLRNYLVRKGFAPAAASQVILTYRETSELVEREAGEHDSHPEPTLEAVMTPGPHMQATRAAPAQPLVLQGNSRQIGRYDFEGGGFVQMLAGGDVDTETALDMIETLLKMKRAEITTKPKVSARPEVVPEPEKNSDG